MNQIQKTTIFMLLVLVQVYGLKAMDGDYQAPEGQLVSNPERYRSYTSRALGFLREKASDAAVQARDSIVNKAKKLITEGQDTLRVKANDAIELRAEAEKVAALQAIEKNRRSRRELFFTGTPKALEDNVKNLVLTRLKREPDLQKKLNDYIAIQHEMWIISDDQHDLVNKNLKTLQYVLQNISPTDIQNLDNFSKTNSISSEVLNMLAAKIFDEKMKNEWVDLGEGSGPRVTPIVEESGE